MKYAEKQRHIFIEETLELRGSINGKDLIEKFKIGSAQASRDLVKFKKLNPNAMEYNLSTKRYEVNTR